MRCTLKQGAVPLFLYSRTNGLTIAQVQLFFVQNVFVRVCSFIIVCAGNGRWLRLFLSFMKERGNDVTYMRCRMGIKAADMASWCGE